jgi:hypothetical protein
MSLTGSVNANEAEVEPGSSKPHSTPFANGSALEPVSEVAGASGVVSEERPPGLVRHKSALKGQGSGEIKNEAFKRAVSWQDFQGKDLHTVVEYTPR